MIVISTRNLNFFRKILTIVDKVYHQALPPSTTPIKTMTSVKKVGAKDTGETIEDITLIGLCTDICVISNALLLKAYLPETQVSVDASCCAGVTRESHEQALNAMKMCQVEIV